MVYKLAAVIICAHIHEIVKDFASFTQEIVHSHHDK